MSLTIEKQTAIKELLRKTIEKKIKEYSRETKSMPFLERIVQDNEKIAAYSFIQSMATTLGQSIFEKASVILAEKDNDPAKSGYDIEGNISPEQQKIISDIVHNLKSGDGKADIQAERDKILNAPKGTGTKVKRRIDFSMCKNGEKYLFEIKTAKPNMDVFKQTKTKLLEWIAITGEPVNVCMALPYNPYYPEPYEHFAKERMMNPPNDFLVGEEYWDFIGGEGSFTELLNIFDEVGKEFKEKLNNKFKEIADKKDL